MSLFTAFVVAVTILNAGYQYTQQQAAKKKAAEAQRRADELADQRKGFELTTEGEVSVLPILYGKGKVGGVRVFHATASSYVHVAGNADKSFKAGSLVLPTTLPKTVKGEKNEYLIFQQAICKRGLTKVYDVTIDDNRKLTDPDLTKSTTGFRVDIHYKGGASCSLINNQVQNRQEARFTDCAYLSTVVKLDRDDPQFSSVPAVSVFAEGVAVRRVIDGVLQPWSVATYSNNPAWVLLDYLLTERKFPESSLDLGSFEAAAAVCDTVVRESAPCGGSIYQPSDGSRLVATRALPLYEANILIDTKKPYRENVTSLLQCMGDARLVWSQGVYKLSLQYPETNDGIVVVDTVTEDRLVLGEPISIAWTPADQRLNFATARFSNESNDFKIDTVSWPYKIEGEDFEGINGRLYSEVSGWDSSTAGAFINDYGVWEGSYGAKTFVWKIVPTVAGTYTLTGILDYSGTITITGGDLPGVVNITQSGVADWRNKSKSTANVVLAENTVYTISISANSTQLKRSGVAATLKAPDGTQFWTTRDISYSEFITVEKDTAVYDEMLAEDNHIPLEMDITLDGITDYYHALAKIEEQVRVSRTAHAVSFTYMLEDRYPEPGDVIKLSVLDIDLGIDNDLFVRIDKAKVTSARTVVIEGTRFDSTQLAWNVDDNYYAKPLPVANTALQAPMWVEYNPGDSLLVDAPGYLTWAGVYESRSIYYEVYVGIPGDESDTGLQLWRLLGQSSTTRFDLPNISEASVLFGVKTVLVASGARSEIQTTSVTSLIRSVPPAPVAVSIAVTGDLNQSVSIDWTIPTNRPDGSVYSNHYASVVYRASVEDFALAQKVISLESSTSFTDTPSVYGELFYWVTNKSTAGIESEPTLIGSVELEFWAQFSDQFIPPAPANLDVVGAFTNIFITWESPFYTGGGGHKASLVYAAEYPLGETVPPIFAESEIVASVAGVEVFVHPVGIDKRFVYWVKEQANGGGISETSAGPSIGYTGKIDGGTDIADATITNAKIESLAAEKITAGTITAAIEMVSPVITAGTGSFTGEVTITNPDAVRAALDLDTAINAVLSNEVHVFPATVDGTVSSYLYSGTNVHVYEGTEEIVYDGVGGSVSTYKITASPTNIIVGTITDSGVYVTIGQHSGVAAGTDVSKITYTITGTASTGQTFSIERVQSFSKSKTGATGLTGTNGAAGQGQVKGVSFLRAATQPSTPVGGTFSSPNATGWSDGIPADNNQPLWQTTRIFTSDGLSPQQSVWSTPAKVGTPSTGARVQFSIDGSTLWHDTPTTSDVYMRSGSSTDNGATWTYGGSTKIKGETGATGAAGPALILTASRQTFKATDGTLDSGQADITLAVVKNNTAETITWTSTPSLVSGTGDSKTLSAATFSTNTQVVVTVTTPSGLTDTITIIRLEKSTAAAGATVGAPTGTNVGSVSAADIAAWAATDTTKIDGGKIYTASVQASSLVSKTITAASGVIGDLAVDTLQLADQAVTIPSSSYTAAAVSIGTTATQVQELTLNSTGAPITLEFSSILELSTSRGSVAIKVTIIRDSSVTLIDAATVAKLSVTDDGGVTTINASYISIIDAPSGGTHSYKLYFTKDSSSHSSYASHNTITALETKK